MAPDPTLVEELYRREQPRLKRLAFLLTGNVEEAEDIVSEAFLRSFPSIERAESPAAYLTRTVINLINDDGRRTTRWRKLRLPREVTAYEEQYTSQSLIVELQVLPIDQRKALVLRYYLDLSVEETARVLGRSRSSTRSLLHRALRHIRKALGDVDQV